MNSLILDVNHMLKNKNFEYAFCGGYAIDLFLGQITRKHKDVDMLAYWKDRDTIIEYMWTLGFEVYEMIGGGQAHRITDINNQMRIKRNIVAVNNCDFIDLNRLNLQIFTILILSLLNKLNQTL